MEIGLCTRSYLETHSYHKEIGGCTRSYLEVHSYHMEIGLCTRSYLEVHSYHMEIGPCTRSYLEAHSYHKEIGRCTRSYLEALSYHMVFGQYRQVCIPGSKQVEMQMVKQVTPAVKVVKGKRLGPRARRRKVHPRVLPNQRRWNFSG